ncbi:amidinotransferase, partial [Kipferlia bialata]|eukprot:g3909.t1
MSRRGSLSYEGDGYVEPVPSFMASQMSAIHKCGEGADCAFHQVPLNSKPAYQFHEDDKAELVLVYRPSQPVSTSALHPVGSLYEVPLNIHQAQKEHDGYVAALKRRGIEVGEVTQLLAKDSEPGQCGRAELEQLAFDSMCYRVSESSAQLKEEQEYYVSDEYKAKVISAMSADQLIDLILTRPTVTLTRADANTPLVAREFRMRPLGNLTFTRDQQITTSRGVVMGRLSSPQRNGEAEIMELVMRRVGIEPIGRIPAPGTLEGGDFIAGGHTMLMGVGLRSNQAAAKFLMGADLLGSERFALVRDVFDRNQDRMHLDCIMSLIGKDVALLDETVA